MSTAQHEAQHDAKPAPITSTYILHAAYCCYRTPYENAALKQAMPKAK